MVNVVLSLERPAYGWFCLLVRQLGTGAAFFKSLFGEHLFVSGCICSSVIRHLPVGVVPFNR